MNARKLLLPGLPLALAGLSVGALIGCASTGAAARPKEPVFTDCLFRQTVDDWAPLDDQHLIIFGYTRDDAYLARLFFPNPDLMFNIGVAIVDDDRSGTICGGSTDALLFGPRSAVPGRNIIASMKKIDRATAEHLLSLTKKKDELKAAIDAVQQPAAVPAN